MSEYELSLSDMGMKIREKDELLEEIKEQEERKKSWVDEKSVKSCMHCSADFTNLTRKVTKMIPALEKFSVEKAFS